MNKNGFFSGNENTDYSASTKKRLASEKLLLLICAGIAAFCDFVMMLVAAVVGYGATVVVFPVVMMLIDALFIVGVRFSNFRFKYSLAVWISYIAASLLMTTLLLALNGGFAGYEIMTTTASALCILSHILLWISICMCALFGNLKKDIKNKIILCSVAGIAVLFMLTYSVFIASNGYFGQGESHNVRTVVYSYDSASDTYTASDVLDGNGSEVVIPETFNGKKVVAVDSKVFAAKDVSSVVLESKESIDMIGLDAKDTINANIKIGVDRSLIDSYRSSLVTTGYDFALSLANSMYPTGLNKEEIYVSFSYDWCDSENVRAQLIPTWIGKKGDTFDISAYSQDITYLAHSDNTLNEDLHWAYTENEGYVFKDITSSDKSIIGAETDESVFGAKVEFERVYRISIGDDNDTLYEPDDSFKTTVLDGVTLDYRYVALSTANSLFGEISREGFFLDWYTEYGYEEIDDLSVYLANRYIEKDRIVTVRPSWTLKPPVIDKLVTNNENNLFVYGDDITFNVAATAPKEGYMLSYTWKNNESEDIGGDKILSLMRVTPDMSGDYSIEIVASSDETSLTSSVVGTVSVRIDKKTLSLVWSFEENAVYDGMLKTASYSYDRQDLVEGDDITLEDDISGVIDAGNYSNTVRITGGMDEFYRLDESASFSYSIAKRPVTAIWNDEDYIYDGSVQHPVVTGLTNTVNDDEQSVLDDISYGNVLSANAGDYTVKAMIDSKNYTFGEEQSKSYSIGKRQITLVWEDKNEFVYNGYNQYPKIAQANDVIEKDKANVLNGMIYEGYGKNAGEYTVSAGLGSASRNYELSQTAEKTYVIAKKDMTVTAVAVNKTYDGKKGGTFNVALDGLAAPDSAASLGTPVFGGDASTAVDAGKYTLEVSYAQNAVTENYNISYRSAVFEIYKKTVGLAWSSTTFNQDGKAHAPFVVEDGKAYDGQIEVTYKYYDSKGSQLDSAPVNAGTYTVEAVAESKNFVFTNTKISFTIRNTEVR